MAYTSSFHSFICDIILNIKLIILPIIFSRSIKHSLGQWTLPYLALILIIPFFIIIHLQKSTFLKTLYYTTGPGLCVWPSFAPPFFLGRREKEGSKGRLYMQAHVLHYYSTGKSCVIYYLFIYIYTQSALDNW